MSARNLAEAHLSFAGMIVWFNSIVIFCLLSSGSESTLRDPDVPKKRRSELEDTLDVFSERGRLDPFSPRHVRHFAQSDLLDLVGEALSFGLIGGAHPV